MSQQAQKHFGVLSSFGVGFIFALGLGISGMTQPQKVLGFLDLFGNWVPDLLWVMGGATGFHLLTYRWIRRRASPLLSPDWHVPTSREITLKLVFGSILFGIGWGLAGYCPGPAITSLASFNEDPAIFCLSMLVGMLAYKFAEKHLPARTS